MKISVYRCPKISLAKFSLTFQVAQKADSEESIRIIGKIVEKVIVKR
jgi:hypothetical protein